MSSPAIEIKGLTKSYGNVHALNGVDIKINEGEFFGLLGPNGAGKTTLLKVLLGLLEPTSGLVQLNNIPISKVSRKSVASHIGYLAQGSPCHWPLTVEKVVELGYLSRGKARNNDTASKLSLSDQAINKLGLSSLRHRLVPTLSGGERQRVAIARALAQEAQYLLLDEPTAHLDLAYQIEVMDLVANIRIQSGITVLSAMHDLTLAAQYCDRVAILNEGTIHSIGTPWDVLTPDTIYETFGAHVTVLPHPDNGTPVIIPTRNTNLPPPGN